MKLLFDQNLSPKLVELLSDVFPESVHVRTVALDRGRVTASRPAATIIEL